MADLDAIFKKLDLSDYISDFNNFLAREKPIFLDGDNKTNLAFIKDLEAHQISLPKSVSNLDNEILHISKFGTLHIEQIYEFVKIINYFSYLKSINFDINFKKWLDNIEIPNSILEICHYFDDDGNLKQSIDERFVFLQEAFKNKQLEIDQNLRNLIYSKNLSPFLVDTQIHFINSTEALLVRGGFNAVIKANIVARSSSGYFYIVPNTILSLKSQRDKIIDQKEEIIIEYCTKISQIFHKNLLFLKFINRAFDRVDGLVARMAFAKDRDFNFILSNSSKNINLVDFSHPALKNPKSISINFDKKVLLITGVNAGGKSMLLKSIISAVILSKYLLPMSISVKSQIGSFKNFELILEDPQNVKNDISTFAGRMISISKLFGKRNLLIGIDEIEIGTDFEEAACLYEVLISNLIKEDNKIIITTHHKRLAVLLSKYDDITPIAALFDEKKSLPKYEFLKDSIGKSYAFETAIRYGIPENMVAMARVSYGSENENLQSAITKALNLEIKLKQELVELNLQKQKLNLAKVKLQEQKADFEIYKNNLISNLESEYYQAINLAKKSINFSDIKDRQRAINKANEAKSKIVLPKNKTIDYNFKVGDFVKYQNLKGFIKNISKDIATIDVNGITMKFNINLLKPSSKSDANLNKPNIRYNIQKPANASISIDLHGLRSDEAIELLDKFISDSLICGFEEVIIKHGIGTGKLAFAVSNFLKSHPMVKEFYDAPPNEGGFGAKIVRF